MSVAVGKPRRVLFVAIDSAWAGAQAQMLELATGLDRGEWEPVLLTSGGGALVAKARAAGVRTRVVPFGFVRRRFPFADFYLAGPVYLWWLLRRERIAIIHAHDPNSPLALAPVAGRLGIPLVAHIHDLDQRWVTRRSLQAMQRTRSAIVAISDAAARWARERGAPTALVRRIHNGVHDAPVAAGGARAAYRAGLGLRDDDVAIVLLGRLVPRKGQEDAIRALGTAQARAERVRLFLIGGAATPERVYEHALRALVGELGLEARVTFLGERDDAGALLAAMDLSIVPSRREAFGRVVIEGLQQGTPVIVYDDGALPELVRDGMDGLVVPTGDVERLASAISRLASDAGLRAWMGTNARVRAREFTHGRFVAEHESLYRELLDHLHHPAASG